MLNRRQFVRIVPTLGVFAASVDAAHAQVPDVAAWPSPPPASGAPRDESFPSQHPFLAKEMVGVAHGNLARVKELGHGTSCACERLMGLGIRRLGDGAGRRVARGQPPNRRIADRPRRGPHDLFSGNAGATRRGEGACRNDSGRQSASRAARHPPRQPRPRGRSASSRSSEVSRVVGQPAEDRRSRSVECRRSLVHRRALRLRRQAARCLRRGFRPKRARHHATWRHEAHPDTSRQARVSPGRCTIRAPSLRAHTGRHNVRYCWIPISSFGRVGRADGLRQGSGGQEALRHRYSALRAEGLGLREKEELGIKDWGLVIRQSQVDGSSQIAVRQRPEASVKQTMKAA